MNDNADQKWRCIGMPKGERARAALHYTALATEAKAWREMIDMEAAATGKLQAGLGGDD